MRNPLTGIAAQLRRLLRPAEAGPRFIDFGDVHEADSSQRRIPVRLAVAVGVVVLLLLVLVVSSLDSSPGNHPAPAAGQGNGQPWWAGDAMPERPRPSLSTPPSSDTYLIVGPETTSPSVSPTLTSPPAQPGRPPVKQPPRAPVRQRYEAEGATITRGAVEANHAGYSGAGFANYENAVGSAVRWTVQAAAAGSATLTIRYANGTAPSRLMDITVNGVVVAAGAAFGGTGAWSTWQSRTFTVPLVAGANTITATATTSAGGPNVDYAEIG